MGQLSPVSKQATAIATRLFGQRIDYEGVCEIHGPYAATGYSRCENLPPCPACEEQRRADEERQRVEEFTRNKMRESGVGEIFLGKTFANYDTSIHPDAPALAAAVRDYAENFRAYRHEGHGRCLMLMGGVGTGKNHLAAAIIRVLVRQGFKAQIIRVYALLRSIKESYRHDSAKSESQIVAELRAPDLLIINEIGVQFDTPGERNMLHDLIDARYDDGKPSAFISNHTETEIKGFLGERIFDRVSNGRKLNITWKSQRERFK
jgi:DNA replication protein DnaC